MIPRRDGEHGGAQGKMLSTTITILGHVFNLMRLIMMIATNLLDETSHLWMRLVLCFALIAFIRFGYEWRNNFRKVCFD